MQKVIKSLEVAEKAGLWKFEVFSRFEVGGSRFEVEQPRDSGSGRQAAS